MIYQLEKEGMLFIDDDDQSCRIKIKEWLRMEQMNKLDGRQQLLVVTAEERGELAGTTKILRRQELYGDTKYIKNLKEEIGDVIV